MTSRAAEDSPWFEVRKGDQGQHRMVITTLPDGSWVSVADWPEVLKLAEWFAHREPYDCSADIYWQGRDYIGTSCGGEVYWTDHEGLYPNTEYSMHQIGSLGHCWECFKGGYGFVRHPVTPGEVIDGTLNAISTRFERDGKPCPACGGGYEKPAMMADALTELARRPDNTPLNGGDYAVMYVSHGPRCARMGYGPEHQAHQGAFEHCIGCRGTCCTGNPAHGPCTCTERDRLAALGLDPDLV